MLYEDDLLFGDPSEVANCLGVTERTLRRYKAKPEAMPEAVKRLLRLRLEGDLCAIGGDAWEGFYLGRDGKLFCPMWQRGMSPAAVRSMFFVQQEAAALRLEVKKLHTELWALRRVREVSGGQIVRGKVRQTAPKLFCEGVALQIGHHRKGSSRT